MKNTYINDNKLKEANSFIFLGCIVDDNEDILNRLIKTARRTFAMLWKNRNVYTTTKIRFFNKKCKMGSLIWSRNLAL